MIYLIDGNETVLIKEKIAELLTKNKIQRSDIYRYDGTNRYFDFKELLENLNTPPFLSARKAVIFKDPPFLIKADKKTVNDNSVNAYLQSFCDYIKEPLYEIDLIIYHDQGKFSSSKILKTIKENAQYLKIETADFYSDAKSAISAYHLNIDQKATQLLIQYANNSISNLKLNLDKLSLYPDKIDEEVVKNICDRSIDALIFNLVNAIFAKDIDKSFSIIRDFRSLDINVFMIIAYIAGQLRFYNEMQYYEKNHYTTNQILKITGAKEFRIRLGFDVLHRYHDLDFLRILCELAKLEQRLKSENLLDPYESLELFIINLEGGHYAGN